MVTFNEICTFYKNTSIYLTRYSLVLDCKIRGSSWKYPHNQNLVDSSNLIRQLKCPNW